MPVSKQYTYPEPIVLLQGEALRIQRLTIDWERGTVMVETHQAAGARRVDARTINFTIADIDGFITNAAAFPGETFLEKLLGLAPLIVPGVPEGGSVEDVPGGP